MKKLLFICSFSFASFACTKEVPQSENVTFTSEECFCTAKIYKYISAPNGTAQEGAYVNSVLLDCSEQGGSSQIVSLPSGSYIIKAQSYNKAINLNFIKTNYHQSIFITF